MQFRAAYSQSKGSWVLKSPQDLWMTIKPFLSKEPQTIPVIAKAANIGIAKTYTAIGYGKLNGFVEEVCIRKGWKPVLHYKINKEDG